MRRPAGPTALASAAVAACGAVAIGVSFVLAVVAAGTDGAQGATHSANSVARAHGPFAVGERVITLVDHSRTIKLPGQRPGPRTLVTVVRYPIVGPPSRIDARNGTPDRAAGPFPLIVFGHGFAVIPATYYRLLRAWAAAGFVVAAPVFPGENQNAPGGPDEADLVNEPRDSSFVITQLLAANAQPGHVLTGMIAPHEIAISGQSDGGEMALAVAYDRYYRDPRVRAAVILSGAQIPSVAALSFPTGAPALLASQGTADTTNLPRNTYAFFKLAHRPKYLLQLLGAGHLPPYTDEQPQLGIVEQTSIAFMRRYLEGEHAAGPAISRNGTRRGLSVLTAEP